MYVCPGGKTLTTTGTRVNDGAMLLYRASKIDCDGCALKPDCCPKEVARKVPRSIHEGARDGTVRNLACEAMMMGSEGASHGDREGLA